MKNRHCAEPWDANANAILTHAIVLEMGVVSCDICVVGLMGFLFSIVVNF